MLERYAASNIGPFYQRHAAGLACVVLGSISLLASFWIQFGTPHDITSATDLRLTLPLLILSVGAGVFSFVRHEKLRPLPITGMAMAVASPMLGWLILVAAVGVVAIVAILIIAKFH